MNKCRFCGNTCVCTGSIEPRTPSQLLKALEAFEAGEWGKKYPAITGDWRRNWDRVIPFFAFPEAVRKIIYTTNAIEALERDVYKRQSRNFLT